MRKNVFDLAERFEEDERRAYRAGRWVSAALFGDVKARDYCERTKGLGLVKAAKEGINTAGGFLVPTEIENAIIAQRALAGVFRQEADTRTMGSDVRVLPRRIAGMTVSFIAEGIAFPDTSASFDSLNLTAKKAGAMTKVSSELYEDEAADLGRFFVEDFGNALADLEDNCGFNGDGTSTYGGMSGITKILIDGKHDAGKVVAAAGHDTAAEIDAADLAKVMGALPEQFWPNAKWYASAYMIGNVFSRLGMTSAGFIQTANGPRPQFAFGGCPIVPTSRLPATAGSLSGSAMLCFGDLRAASVLGSRRGLSIAQSTQGQTFDTDQVMLRGSERFDLVNHSLGDNTTAGAIVGLVGA